MVLPLLLSPVIAYRRRRTCWSGPRRWAARYTPPNVVNSRSRRAQAIAAGAVAFGHGLQDGQRTSAVLILALLAAGLSDGGSVPVWVALLTAVLLTAGPWPAAGGFRTPSATG